MLLGATYFNRNSRDLINFFDCSTPSPLCATEPFGYYANIARASAHGVELQSSFSPMTYLTIAGNYTYTATEDRSVGATTFGNELPRRPKSAANVSASYRWPSGLTMAVAVRYSGRAFDNAASTIVLHDFAVVDIRAAYALSTHLEVYGRIENVGDKQYETAYQYGMLGRGGAAQSLLVVADDGECATRFRDPELPDSGVSGR